jgi:hypothetical protein
MTNHATSEAKPREEDWVLLISPSVVDETLLLGELVWSSNGPRAGPIGEASPGRALFSAMTSPLRKRLTYPTWSKNVVHDGPSGPIRTVGHTQAAAEHARRGGILRTREAVNLRFYPEDPDRAG